MTKTIIPLSHSCLETIKNKSISQTVALGDIFLHEHGHSSLFYCIFVKHLINWLQADSHKQNREVREYCEMDKYCCFGCFHGFYWKYVQNNAIFVLWLMCRLIFFSFSLVHAHFAFIISVGDKTDGHISNICWKAIWYTMWYQSMLDYLLHAESVL